MRGNLLPTVRIFLIVLTLIAFRAAGARWGSNGHSCAAAPAAIEHWSSGMHVRYPNDRATLQSFLAKRPDAANAHYGVDCGTPLHAAARLGRDDLAQVLI